MSLVENMIDIHKATPNLIPDLTPNLSFEHAVIENTLQTRLARLGITKPADFAAFVDHTILKADATASQILRLAEEAKNFGFFSVCVNGSWIETCKRVLDGSSVKICAVVCFPLGATTPAAKAFEAENYLRLGAHEIDMVLNIGALKSESPAKVLEDIRAVSAVTKEHAATLKVIIETALLTREEKVLACKLSVEAGADFVKTSTGFSTAGATPADVALMRETVGSGIGVKASGGIKNLDAALNMLEAGANRLGLSGSVVITDETKAHVTRAV